MTRVISGNKGRGRAAHCGGPEPSLPSRPRPRPRTHTPVSAVTYTPRVSAHSVLLALPAPSALHLPSLPLVSAACHRQFPTTSASASGSLGTRPESGEEGRVVRVQRGNGSNDEACRRSWTAWACQLWDGGCLVRGPPPPEEKAGRGSNFVFRTRPLLMYSPLSALSYPAASMWSALGNHFSLQARGPHRGGRTAEGAMQTWVRRKVRQGPAHDGRNCRN